MSATPSDASADRATDGTDSRQDGGADMSSECALAVDAYRILLESFDRTCGAHDDCGWFDHLGEFGCGRPGNADADPTPILEAKQVVEESCTPREKTEQDYADNNFVCAYQKDGALNGTFTGELFCDGGVCSVR